MPKRTPVPAKPAPQTEEEAANHALQYVQETAWLNRLEAEETKKLAELKERYAKLKKPHTEAREEHFKLAHLWAEANRAGRKTIKLPNGRELQWRLPSSPSLIIADGKLWGVVKALLQLENWTRYLKVDLKKGNIKADLEELHQSSSNLRRWLRLDTTEYFRIK